MKSKGNKDKTLEEAIVDLYVNLKIQENVKLNYKGLV